MKNLFFLNRHQVANLMAKKNNMQEIISLLNDIKRRSKGKKIVAPNFLKGGFLPSCLREAGVELLPVGEFNRLRSEALETAKNGGVRITGKTARKKASPTAGKNPTNVPGQGPAKGGSGSKPGMASNPKKAAKRAKLAAAKKKK